MAVRPYATACGDLRDLARSGARAWLDPSTASAALFAAAEAGAAARAGAAFARAKKARGNVGYESKEGAEAAAAEEAVLRAPSPVALAKALKNDAELAGMHACHARDGAAVVRFLSWLQGAVDAGEALDECSVADVLEGFRAKDPLFRSLSFDTIAGAGPNGAIIHYRAEPSSCRGLRAGELFLLDSGAQYEDGTTDVTRTVQLGSGAADPFHSACFTAVLKGNIALDSAIFPEGTPGFALDSFARQALWRAGLDYRHGTGHGVGAALNVHEGPQSISPRWGNTTPLQSGMVLSNEPGYYGASARKSPPSPPAHMHSSTRLPTLTVRARAHTHIEDGSFGIRIENLLVVREAKTEHNFGGKTYLGFERLTHIPIQKALIDVALLTTEEADWVDAYHADVYALIAPLLEDDEEDASALAFLKEATAPLDREGQGSAIRGAPALVGAARE